MREFHSSILQRLQRSKFQTEDIMIMPKRNKSNPTGEELLFSWQTSKLHIQKQKSCFVSPTIYVISFMFVTLKTFSCTWETKSDHVRRSKWNYTSLLYIWFTKCVTVRDSLISHPDLNFHVNETHSHPSVCRPLQTCFQFTFSGLVSFSLLIPTSEPWVIVQFN